MTTVAGRTNGAKYENRRSQPSKPFRFASSAITSAMITSGGVLIAVKTRVFLSESQTAGSPNISRQFASPRNSCFTPARLVLKKLFHRPATVGQSRKNANSTPNGATKNSPPHFSVQGGPGRGGSPCAGGAGVRVGV